MLAEVVSHWIKLSLIVLEISRNWNYSLELQDGPTMFTGAETLNDFPTVPNQKPTLRTHLPQPDNFTNSNSGRFAEDKAEPTNSPRTVDVHRTSSQGTRSGPPSRKPPGIEQSKTENSSFDDRHTDMDSERREAQSRRNSYAPSSLAQHQDEESRRNSIGVPREKSGRAHTGSAVTGVDEALPMKHIRRESQAAEVDDFDGSHRSDRRQSQKYDAGKGQVQETNADPFYMKDSRPARTSYEDLNHTSDDDEQGVLVNTWPGTDGGRKTQTRQNQDLEEDNHSTVYRREGSGKLNPRKQDQDLDGDNYRKVPSREGSGKARARHEDQESDEHDLKRAPNREGSGKGRPHHADHYAEGENFRRASSKEGAGNKMNFEETSVEEGSYGRISGRGKEGKQYAGKYQRHDASDEDADHIPHRSEEPRRRDTTKNTPKYADEDTHNPDWDDESFRDNITTRIPRKSEDEYRDSGKGTRRDSLNTRVGVSSQDDYSVHVSEDGEGARKKQGTFVDDTLRKNNNLAVRKKDNEKSISDTPHYDSSEDEDDLRRGGARKPEPRHSDFKATNTRNSDRSSESGEEGSRQSTRRIPRLRSVDEQRKDSLDEQGSSNGKRYGREDPDSMKTSRNSRFDNGNVDFDDGRFTTSSRTEKRMSLPGGNVRDKSKYQGNRDSDDYDDTVRPSERRATIGSEEIRARARETEDPSRSRYGEKEKQLDTRRQSAPLPKDDIMERRQSPSYSSESDRPDRHRKPDISAGYEDERPPRYSNPKVGLDVEYLPNTRAQKDRPVRQRKSDMSPRYDDDKPPPRFIKVGKQANLDDEKPQRFVNSPRRNDVPLQPAPRPRSNLQSVKTDPALSETLKPTAPEHRKSQSASEGQPQSKPVFMKPPDLDVLIQMFGNKGKKK